MGEMVPTKTLVKLKRTFGPETVTRNNLFNAVTINGTPKPGYSTGDAIKAVEEVAKQSLPVVMVTNGQVLHVKRLKQADRLHLSSC